MCKRRALLSFSVLVLASLAVLPSLCDARSTKRPGFLSQPAITNLDPVEAEVITEESSQSKNESSASNESSKPASPRSESSWVDVFPDGAEGSEGSAHTRKRSGRSNNTQSEASESAVSEDSASLESGLTDNNSGRRSKQSKNKKKRTKRPSVPEVHTIFRNSVDAFEMASAIRNRLGGMTVAQRIAFLNARDAEGYTVLMRTAQLGDADSVQRMEALIDEYYPSILQTALKCKNATAYQMANGAGKTAFADAYLSKIREKTSLPSDSKGDIEITGAILSSSVPTVAFRVCRFVNTPLAIEDTEKINSDLRSDRARSELVVSVTGVRLTVAALDTDRVIFDEWWSSVMPMQPSLSNASDPTFRDTGTFALQAGNRVFVLEMKSSCASTAGVPLAARAIVAIAKTTSSIAAAMDASASPKKTVSIYFSSDPKHSFSSVRLFSPSTGSRVFPRRGLRVTTKDMSLSNSSSSSGDGARTRVICVASDELLSGAVIAVSNADERAMNIARQRNERQKVRPKFHADTLQYQVALVEDPFIADSTQGLPTAGDTVMASSNPLVSGEPNLLGESVFLRMDGKQVTVQLSKGSSSSVPDVWAIPLQQLAYHTAKDSTQNSTAASGSSESSSSGLLFLYHTLSVDQLRSLAADRIKSGALEQSPALKWLVPLASGGVDNPLQRLKGPKVDVKWVLSTDDAATIATVIRKDIRAALDDLSRLRKDVYASLDKPSPFEIDRAHCSALSPRRSWCIASGCVFCGGVCRAQAPSSNACTARTGTHDDFETPGPLTSPVNPLVDAVFSVFGGREGYSEVPNGEARAVYRVSRRRAVRGLQRTGRIRIAGV